MSGYRHGQAPDGATDKSAGYSVDASTRAARRRPQEYLPPVTQEQRTSALYYSDLGPATIDVSAYPPRQRYNYAIYSRVCSQCHTLARSINAPTVNRHFWEFYIASMRISAYFRANAEISKEDVQNIIDFLEYDSNARKVLHRSEFEELTDELKLRFEPILKERIRTLQQSKQPVIPAQ